MQYIFASILSLFLILSPVTQGSGKHLDRSNGGRVQSLHPHFFSCDVCASVIYDLYEGLLVLAPDGSVVDGIATPKKIDGTHWEFKLKDNLKWSNGEPLTGEDIVASFRHLAFLGAKCRTDDTLKKVVTYAHYLEIARIKYANEILSGQKDPVALGVEVHPSDPGTVQITLEDEPPEMVFPYLLTFPSFLPVHQSHRTEAISLNDLNSLSGEVITNGPYCFFSSGTKAGLADSCGIKLVKNPHYHSKDLVEVESVQWHAITDRLSEKELLTGGKLDITAGIPAREYRSLKEKPYFVSTQHPLRQSGFIIPDHRKSHIVELAPIVSKAINRQGLIDELYPGCIGCQPALRFIPPGMKNAGEFSLHEATEGNFTEWCTRNAEIKTITLMKPTSSDPDGLLDIIKKQLEQGLAPLKIKIKEVPANEFFGQLQNGGDYDFACYGWVAAFDEPYAFVMALMDNHKMIPSAKAPKLTVLMQQSQSISSPEKLQELYVEAEKLIAEETHIVPLIFKPQFRLVSDRVRESYIKMNTNPLGWVFTKSLSIAEPVN